MLTISLIFNSQKELTDNHTDNMCKHHSKTSHNKTKHLICQIAIENSLRSQKLYGLNLWICSVKFFPNIAHAHFQQSRVEVNYQLDKHANDNAKRGYIDIRKGESSFWKALDDSNDPKNIEKVQRSIGDETPLDFKLR